MEIGNGSSIVVLQGADGHAVSLQLYTVDSEVVDGARVLTSYFQLFEDGRQVGGSRLSELTAIPEDQLFAGGSRFKVRSGDSFTLYGQAFELTRVTSTSLLERSGYADSKTAAYVRSQ